MATDDFINGVEAFFIDKGNMKKSTLMTYMNRWKSLAKSPLFGACTNNFSAPMTNESFLDTFNNQYTPDDVYDWFCRSYENPYTLKAYFQAFLLLTREHTPTRLKDAHLAKYANYFRNVKQQEQGHHASKVRESTYNPSEILQKIESCHGTCSEPALLVRLYMDIPVRDDFGEVYIIKPGHASRYEDHNCLCWSGTPGDYATFYLRKYKTVHKHGPKEYIVQPHLTRLMAELGKAPGEQLFTCGTLDPSTDCKKLGPIFKRWMNQADIDTRGGAINMLRHGIITNSLEKDDSAQNRTRLADDACHTPFTSMTYIRNIIDK